MIKSKQLSVLRWGASVSAGALMAAMATAPSFAAEVATTATAAATADASSATIGEIVVTARKRNEKLLDIPVAVSAITSQGIQSRGITSLSQLASFTPGLSDNSTIGGSGRNDRSFPQYIIRGMVPSLTTNPTTTVFIDGAPLISGQIDALDDLQRIEVLKGPQSAYFGRETFAGAISLVTKDPSNTPSFSVNALAGSRNYGDIRLGVEGPIIQDKLTARLSYRYFTKDGSYDNNAVANKASGKLGNQSTQSVTLQVVATPTADLKIKALAMYWHDNDGASAQALIVPSQSNCLGFWFCGVVPDRLSNQPAANTAVTGPIKALLAYLGTPAAHQSFKPLNDRYGLARNAYHGSIGADYNLPYGMTFSSLSAVDNQQYSELQDLANDDGSGFSNFAYTIGQPFANSYYDFPFFVENSYRNFSQEFRLTSSQDTRFRWIVGVNYAWSRVEGSIGGGNGFDFFAAAPPPSTSRNTAGFFGLNYDILPELTATVEGRYQSDEESTYTAGKNFKGTFNDFIPRLSVQYKFMPGIMAYATYSQGVNPGSFNGALITLPKAQADFIATNFGAQVEVRPEKLTNYEVGLKGRFFDGKATLAGDIYYDVWTDQINVASIQFFAPNPTPGLPDILETTTANLNNGKTNLWGLEIDGTLQPIDHLDLNASAAINNTDIVTGGCFTCLERTGTTSVKGNELPNVSRYQAAFGIQYGGPLANFAGGEFKSLTGWDWFARLDYTYKSGSYEDKDNLVRTPDENLVNLRAGVTSGPLRLEAFVNNVTNDDSATNLAAIINLGNPAETFAHTSNALVAGLPELRTFGVRAQWKFGG